MIRFAVMYPNEPGKRFDFEYYLDKHLAFVKDKLKPVRIEVDRGVPDTENNPPTYIAIGTLTFETMAQLAKGFAAFGAELAADIPNYTNIQPVFQISESVEL